MEASPEPRPELKQLIGALILAARRPLSVREIRRLLEGAAAEGQEGRPDVEAPAATFKDRDIREAAEALGNELKLARFGFGLEEGPEGYRFKTDPSCGPWVRRLLETGRGQRLSRPALETLAIIAWRQPITRADIEAIRGVSVDHVLKILLELQLVRIVGRSELPGRPLLYGTTTCFLEHFGLKDLSELPRLEELARLDTVRQARERESGEPPFSSEPPLETPPPSGEPTLSAGCEEAPVSDEPPLDISRNSPCVETEKHSPQENVS